MPSKPSCSGSGLRGAGARFRLGRAAGSVEPLLSRTWPILPLGCDTERWWRARVADPAPGSGPMGFLRWLRGGDENGAAASAISAGLAEIDGLFRPSKHKQTEHVEESKRKRIDVANGAGIDLDRNVAV